MRVEVVLVVVVEKRGRPSLQSEEGNLVQFAPLKRAEEALFFCPNRVITGL